MAGENLMEPEWDKMGLAMSGDGFKMYGVNMMYILTAQ
jgi:hypothetical protein